MKTATTYPLTKPIISSFGLLFLIFAFSQCQTTHEKFDNKSKANKEIQTNAVDTKQRGTHVFGVRDSSNFEFLKQNNIEWITMVSWGFQENHNSPKVNHQNGDSLSMAKHDSSWVNRLDQIHSAGFKTFFKPHVWIDKPVDGKWRSDIFPTSDENWELWKESYRNFILRYAHVAERANVDMFCLGTEFTKLTLEKPAYWKDLITEVRRVYSGQLTYAANWYSEFENLSFWKDLDFIGIQAYFPLVENKYPSAGEISEGWKEHLPSIEFVSKKNDRKVIFTEMGYKSTADGAIKPWEWIEYGTDQKRAISHETQANCYQAFFNTVWPKDWFKGVHLWQMRTDELNSERGVNQLDFTPRGKPAEKIIGDGFKRQ